jgi:flagellar biosynthetic protein FliO
MSSVSVAGLLLRLVLSLGIVIGVMAMLAKLARGRLGRVGARTPKSPYQLQVLSRQQIGKNASVLLVRAGDRGLLLGVTEHSVSLIQETEIPPVVDAEPAVAPRVGGAMLHRARELTVRKA